MNVVLPLARVRTHPSRAIVAIPACDEAEAIETCLAALAIQRDGFGAPLRAGRFEILVYANNSRDRTVAIAEAFAKTCPHPVVVISATHEPARANAGCARKAAMDLAAERLEVTGCYDALILTTDADSAVSPTWVAATLAAFDDPVDCVAGYIDAFPVELMRLGPQFVQRGRWEDHYLRLMAEIYARCDPRPHDPWPNHRVSSGASLAVRLDVYRAVGGLPALALGEDVALTRLLETKGFKVRHPMSVTVGTSCRFDGRAKGGAADTMRLRHAIADAPCDNDIELALAVLRRALCRGALRRAHAAGALRAPVWGRRLGWSEQAWFACLDRWHDPVFEAFWLQLEAHSPVLARRHTLRPADLPHQILRAEAILQRLRNDRSATIEAAPTDRRRQPAARVPEPA